MKQMVQILVEHHFHSSSFLPLSFQAAPTFAGDMEKLLDELEIGPKGREFLKSLGGKCLEDFAIAIEDGDLSKKHLTDNGVAKIPASKLISAIQAVCRLIFLIFNMVAI